MIRTKPAGFGPRAGDRRAPGWARRHSLARILPVGALQPTLALHSRGGRGQKQLTARQPYGVTLGASQRPERESATPRIARVPVAPRTQVVATSRRKFAGAAQKNRAVFLVKVASHERLECRFPRAITIGVRLFGIRFSARWWARPLLRPKSSWIRRERLQDTRQGVTSDTPNRCLTPRARGEGPPVCGRRMA
jgi:hypothetical protein